MKLLTGILTLSLSTRALAFNLALAAAIERKGRTTSTITKTIYHTEVRILQDGYTGNDGSSDNTVPNESTTLFTEGASEAEHYRVGSSISAVYHNPRRPSGGNPTSSRAPVNDNSFVSNTMTVESASSNNTTKRNVTPDYEHKKRKTHLYNYRADLAPEGYLSVYMSNSTAATFCESEMKEDSDGSPKARELYLNVLDATKTVVIPVHGEAAASFCLEFREAEDVNDAKSSKATGKSTATASSKEKTKKVSTTGDTLESTSTLSKHTTSQVPVLETDSETSTTKTRSSHTDETSDISEAPKSKKRMSSSTTASDTASMSPASVADVSSKSKSKSFTSEAEEETQELTSSDVALTETKYTDTDSSSPDTSTSYSPKSKSKTFSVENPKDVVADPELSPTPKATPLALTATVTQDTTEEDIFTMSSMNTWYPYISQYLKTAEDSVPTADSTDQDPITTIASINGAARLERRGVSTVTEKSASTRRTTTLKSETMQYTSDYSWLGTGTHSPPRGSGSGVVVLTATRNAAGKRVGSPFVWWRRGDERRATDVVGARMEGSGDVEEAGQEKDGFFNIVVDEVGDEVAAETTGVGAEASGTEEAVIATKLAVKLQDADEEDEDRSKEEGKQFGLKEETLADKEATGDEDTVPDKAAKEDGDEKKESTSKDEEEDAAPTAETSTDTNDNPPSTKKKPATDKEPTPTHDADNDTPADDDDTAKPDNETPTRSFKHHKPTPSNTHKTSSPSAKPKPKPHIPSLAPSISFIFPQATPSLLPTPPPAPTGPDAQQNTHITWDPSCPQIHTSTSTAENGVTSLVPVTVGLGCWRSVTPSGDRDRDRNGTEGYASSAFTILSGSQARGLGVLCWMVVAGMILGFVTSQYQFVRGSWHVGRNFVWWMLGLEMWGLGTRIKEKMEEAERQWERERERGRRMEMGAESSGRAP